MNQPNLTTISKPNSNPVTDAVEKFREVDPTFKDVKAGFNKKVRQPARKVVNRLGMAGAMVTQGILEKKGPLGFVGNFLEYIEKRGEGDIPKEWMTALNTVNLGFKGLIGLMSVAGAPLFLLSLSNDLLAMELKKRLNTDNLYENLKRGWESVNLKPERIRNKKFQELFPYDPYEKEIAYRAWTNLLLDSENIEKYGLTEGDILLAVKYTQNHSLFPPHSPERESFIQIRAFKLIEYWNSLVDTNVIQGNKLNNFGADLNFAEDTVELLIDNQQLPNYQNPNYQAVANAIQPQIQNQPILINEDLITTNLEDPSQTIYQLGINFASTASSNLRIDNLNEDSPEKRELILIKVNEAKSLVRGINPPSADEEIKQVFRLLVNFQPIANPRIQAIYNQLILIFPNQDSFDTWLNLPTGIFSSREQELNNLLVERFNRIANVQTERYNETTQIGLEQGIGLLLDQNKVTYFGGVNNFNLANVGGVNNLGEQYLLKIVFSLTGKQNINQNDLNLVRAWFMGDRESDTLLKISNIRNHPNFQILGNSIPNLSELQILKILKDQVPKEDYEKLVSFAFLMRYIDSFPPQFQQVGIADLNSMKQALEYIKATPQQRDSLRRQNNQNSPYTAFIRFNQLSNNLLNERMTQQDLVTLTRNIYGLESNRINLQDIQNAENIRQYYLNRRDIYSELGLKYDASPDDIKKEIDVLKSEINTAKKILTPGDPLYELAHNTNLRSDPNYRYKGSVWNYMLESGFITWLRKPNTQTAINDYLNNSANTYLDKAEYRDFIDELNKLSKLIPNFQNFLLDTNTYSETNLYLIAIYNSNREEFKKYISDNEQLINFYDFLQNNPNIQNIFNDQYESYLIESEDISLKDDPRFNRDLSDPEYKIDIPWVINGQKDKVEFAARKIKSYENELERVVSLNLPAQGLNNPNFRNRITQILLNDRHLHSDIEILNENSFETLRILRVIDKLIRMDPTVIGNWNRIRNFILAPNNEQRVLEILGNNTDNNDFNQNALESLRKHFLEFENSELIKQLINDPTTANNALPLLIMWYGSIEYARNLTQKTSQLGFPTTLEGCVKKSKELSDVVNRNPQVRTSLNNVINYINTVGNITPNELRQLPPITKDIYRYQGTDPVLIRLKQVLDPGITGIPLGSPLEEPLLYLLNNLKNMWGNLGTFPNLNNFNQDLLISMFRYMLDNSIRSIGNEIRQNQEALNVIYERDTSRVINLDDKKEKDKKNNERIAAQKNRIQELRMKGVYIPKIEELVGVVSYLRRVKLDRKTRETGDKTAAARVSGDTVENQKKVNSNLAA